MNDDNNNKRELRINEDEKNRFEFLIHAVKNDQVSLVSTTMNGEKVTVLTFIQQDDETQEYVVTPLAVMVDNDIMDMLEDPANV